MEIENIITEIKATENYFFVAENKKEKYIEGKMFFDKKDAENKLKEQ